MFVLIDNYDSFTYNLFHLLGELGAAVEVMRNDAITVDQLLSLAPEGVILSPGPCTPNEAGICLDVVHQASSRLPILGVCLGLQSIGQAFGGEVVRAPLPMHGKVDRLTHTRDGIFAGLPSPFTATRYHSLMVRRETLPDCLAVTAESSDGVIMGLEHKSLPVHGVQFHPESIASEHGARLVRNFLRLADAWRLRHP